MKKELIGTMSCVTLQKKGREMQKQVDQATLHKLDPVESTKPARKCAKLDAAPVQTFVDKEKSDSDNSEESDDSDDSD